MMEVFLASSPNWITRVRLVRRARENRIDFMCKGLGVMDCLFSQYSFISLFLGVLGYPLVLYRRLACVTLSKTNSIYFLRYLVKHETYFVLQQSQLLIGFVKEPLKFCVLLVNY